MGRMSHPGRSLVDLAVHELRSPLNVALGSLRMAIRAAEASPARQSLLERAVRACEQLERTCNEMRDWTRLEAGGGPTAAVDLMNSLRDAARRAEAAGNGAVRVSVRDTRDRVFVRAMPDRLTDALTAALRSVVRAADADAVIPVKVESVAAGEAVSVEIGSPGLQDDAEPESIDRIGGLAFSLPLGRSVIEAGGGTMWVAQVDGRVAGVGIRLRRFAQGEDGV